MAKRETQPVYAKLARKGDVADLFALSDGKADSPNDRLAYKWLSAAIDFGHEDAEDLVDELMESSSLRYDDSGCETAAAHWELAVAYLAGEEGLPRNLEHAATHLQKAFDNHDLRSINAGMNASYSAEEVLARLTGKAKELLAFELGGGDPARRVVDRATLVERLVSCKAPAVMVEGQKRLLRQAADSFFAKTPAGHDLLRERVRALLG